MQQQQQQQQLGATMRSQADVVRALARLDSAEQ